MDPFAQFDRWYQEAQVHEHSLPEAMSLATATRQGRPSLRVVLAKEVSAAGVVFFTNFGSRKSLELQENPWASACFHWKSLQRQVTMEGPTERLDDAASDRYFASRPRGSQIGAWASLQSQPLASWEALEEAVAEQEARFAGQQVPRPPHWGGFRLLPERVEFWQLRADRLNHRQVYQRRDGDWEVGLLWP